MEISANMVKELRAATGAGVLDCRKALDTAEGDFNRAVGILREKGLSTAAKKASREAKEGLIGNFVRPDNKLAAMVEVNCETDFVARTTEFQQMCQDLARMIAENASLTTAEDVLAQPYPGGDGRSVQAILTEKIAKIGENMLVRRPARLELAGKPGMIGNYVHMGSKVAAIVEVTCGSDAGAQRPEFQQLVKDLSMQIVAARPKWVGRQDVPVDVLEKEKDTYRAEMSDANKPPAVLERILEGKLGKFYQENCLLEQPFIREDSKQIKDVVAETSAKIGEKLEVVRFARLEVGD